MLWLQVQRLPRLPAELITTTAQGADTVATLIRGLLDVHLDEPVVLVVDDAGALSAGGDAARLIESLCLRGPELLSVVLLTRGELGFDPGPAVVLTGEGHSEDELAASTLAAEPEENRELLRAIATLGRVSTALCVALGFTDVRETLRGLARRGLLTGPDWSVVEPIAELVRRDTEDPEIRVKAAIFCERTGAHAEALRHLVAARKWDLVAQLSEFLEDFHF